MTAAVAEVSERLQLLVREEIELAKAEVATKISKIAKGAAVGAAGGIFFVAGLLFALHGLSWLAWDKVGSGPSDQWLGFFIVAGALFLLGILAAYLAFRFLRAGSPPTPTLAIDEAKLIRETMQRSGPPAPITPPGPAS
jgi:putative superfamily III holin-X